jgi:putative PIN family toxin of toxin-antitoxin system
MIQRVVFDTNVIVSALLSPLGNPARALKIAVSGGNVQICHNSRIFAEYREVLSRPKLNIATEDSDTLLDILFLMGLSITPEVSTVPMADEKDRIFYDTAKTCTAALVTGNKRHYPPEPCILTPTEFVETMNRDKAP